LHDSAVYKALRAVTILTFAWTVVVRLTGGIDTRIAGVALRSRDVFRPGIITLALLMVQAVWHRAAASRDIEQLAASLARAAVPIGVCAAVLISGCAIYFGSAIAGGSDPYGYVSQAYGWANGPLPKPIPLLLQLAVPAPDPIQIPLGYRPGPQAHTMVPTYSPGLPLIMAAALIVGHTGPFLVVPAFAALLVWLTFAFARRAAGPAAGVCAALVILTSPIVLYQSIFPMSDVPAGAMWTAAALASLRPTRRGAAIAGLSVAAALLIRPNLLPLAVVPFLQVALSARGRERWVRIAVFALAIAPASLFIAFLNAMWFGGPWKSGYGGLGELYAVSNIRANLARYPAWFLQSQSLWALVGIVPLLPMFRRHSDWPTIRLAVAMIASTIACYATYAPFEQWSYLRFMLPCMGAVAVLIAVGLVSLVRTMPLPWGYLASALVLCSLLASTMRFSQEARVFGGVKAGERRYAEIGAFVASDFPENAVVLTMQHSGTIRWYGGRVTVRYDLLPKEWANQVPLEIERAGYHPYMSSTTGRDPT
jgi:hypothetical protein